MEKIDILVLADVTRVFFYRGAQVVGSALLVPADTRAARSAIKKTAMRVAQTRYGFSRTATVVVRDR